MSDLWPKYTLGELVLKVGSGATPKGGEAVYKPYGTPLIRSMNVVFFDFKRDGLAFIDDTQATNLKNAEVKSQDVLLNITGASIGRVTMAPKDMNGARVNQHVCIIRPTEVLDNRFLNAYLSSPSMQAQIWSDNYGVTRQALTKQQILDFEIPLPPLNEQKRIADKLDAVLARVDACRDRIDRIPAILRRFRQSVLAAATSGVLTEDWRKQFNRQEEWNLVSLADIGELGRGKSKHRPRNDSRLYGGPYPFIQTGAVAQSGGFITTHLQTYSEFGLSQSKLWPAGTLCITIAANIADTAILTYPACFPDSVVGLVVNPAKCIPQYAKWSIDVISDQLESFAPATAQKNINLAVLNDVRFNCPEIDEQTEIVRRVESLFAYADRLEARYNTARAQVEKLTPALLAKAFRGELVPQDPNDEPAAELLKRISAQTATKVSSKKIATRRKSKKDLPASINSSDVPENQAVKNQFIAKLENISPNHLAKILNTTKQLDAKTLWKASELNIDDFYVQLNREINAGWLRVNEDDESKLELVNSDL